MKKFSHPTPSAPINLAAKLPNQTTIMTVAVVGQPLEATNTSIASVMI